MDVGLKWLETSIWHNTLRNFDLLANVVILRRPKEMPVLHAQEER